MARIPIMHDRRNLPSIVRRTNRNLRAATGPGFLGGRSSLPQPVLDESWIESLLDDDPDEELADDDQPTWEDKDRHRLTTLEVSKGFFRHQLKHTDIVGEFEFLATVNGATIDPDQYSLDSENGVVVMALGGWEPVRTEFRFFYAYIGVSLDPGDPIGLTYIGAQARHDYSTVIQYTTLPLAAGVQEDDLIALNMVGYDTVMNCPDPRMTKIFDSSSEVGARVQVWVGRDDGTGSPLQMDVDFYAPGQYLNDIQARTHVIRGVDGQAADWVGIVSDGSRARGGIVPGVHEGISGALAIGSSSGGIGGSYGWYWPGPWGNLGGTGTYTYTTTGFLSATDIADTNLNAVSYSPSNWRGLLIGIGMGLP